MRGKIVAGLIVGFVFALTGRQAVSDQHHYEGKTIRILVSSSPGGGTDTAARLVARFLPKYIPGNPKTIVQNMPGGGGTIANNYFASEVRPDGLTIFQDSSSGVENFLRGGPRIKYDPRKFVYIGGISRGGSLLLIRKEALPRLTNRGAQPVIVGDTDGIRSWIAMTVWGAEYLGWNIKWIYGYPGSRELALAIRQGEIDMWSTQNAKLVQDLQREAVVEILCSQDDERRKDFAQVRTFVEILGEKRPKGVAWQAYTGMAGPSELDKFLVVPPGTPARLLKILRNAFEKTMKDPEVDKEGDKFFGDGWRPHPGEKMEKVIREHVDRPKEVTDFITKMRQKYGLPLGEKKG